MGRRSSVATVVSGVDSSPSSAESSFRELDDVFLQTQTRIWLGEVLKIRLDEQLKISNLLADGELLFEVSKNVWNMLLGKCVELRQIKANQCPLGSKKSSGRYRPYSNVDTFLKICKILGLNGIDLFSPSDVVEKRDTRKVCICIRALSKKARSKQLNVPDFDMVTYTVAMPTDMVGCIRRSLESSQCSISSSSGSISFKGTISKSQQKKLVSACTGNYDSCSEESDEAESTYFGLESYSSSINKFDYPVTVNSDTENSPGAFSAVKQYTASRSDMRTRYANEHGKACSFHQSRNDHQANNLSTCHFKRQGYLHDKALHTNNDSRHSYGNASELANIDLALGNDTSDIRNSLSDHVAERDFISDYLAFSDSVVLGTDGSSPVFFDGEDNICNFFMGIDSHGLKSKQVSFENGFQQRSSDDMEDVEVSSMTSMTSVLGRVLNMDFDDQYNAGDSSIVKLNSAGFSDNETDNQDKGSFMEDHTRDSAQDEILSQCSATDIKESESEMKLENEGFCTNFLSTCKDSGGPYTLESQKVELYGDSQIHLGSTFSLKSTDVAPAEDDKDFFKYRDLQNEVMGISELIPDFDQHGKNYIPVETLHCKTYGETKVFRNEFSVQGNESCLSSLPYQDVVIKNATNQGSRETLDGTLVNHDFASLAKECEPIAEQYPSSSPKDSGVIIVAGHQASTGHNESILCHSENRNEDDRNHNYLGISAENVLHGNKDPSDGTHEDKRHRRSLLKTVIRGTTLIGVLFILLHIRRRGKEEADTPHKPLKTQKFVGAKSSLQRGQSGRPNGTYPAEKLNFGR